MLVLLSLIVLTFIASVTTDLPDSKAYEGQTTTRMLADSAVNLVIGEIRQASTTANQAWISQPGLLRTYDLNGNPVAAYKLYSSGSMVVPGAFDPNAGTDLPTGNTWMNQPNLYTDLNSPFASGITTTGNINYIFPIIDGNGIKSLGGTFTYSSDGIIPTIEGFSTNPSQQNYTYNNGAALSATNNPVPMPVKWLYMLKDGTLISGSAAGTSKDVTFSGSIAPSGTNPIVARIAFWTDDESCKININTASEGIFQDTPVCNTQPNVLDVSEPDPAGNPAYLSDPNQVYEWDLAQRCADQGEYQRYPGHPASTCLSPVLGDTIYKGLTLSAIPTTGTGIGYHSLTGSGWAEFTEFINQLTPRVSGSDVPGTSGTDYSSKGGTYRPGGPNLSASGTSAALINGQPITPDQDRLYATVDDYFYSGTIPSGTTTRNNNNGLLLPGTNSGTYFNPILSPALLEKARFFLTADSKAPEVNSFNMPRVCMWPITKQDATTLDQSDLTQANVTAKMTSFDKVIAFCATASGTAAVSGSFNRVPFYLSRYDALSGTHDWGSTNQTLYTYLQNLTSLPFPGFGPGTFAGKYKSDKDQILTEIFDYIRCTNLADTSQDTASHSNSYTQVPYQNPSSWTPPPGGLTLQGQVVPLVVSSNNTRGVGRIATIGEMALVMIKEDNRITNTLAESALTGTITLSSGPNMGTYVYSGTQVPNTQNVLLTGSNLYNAAKGKVYTGSKDYSPLPAPATSTTLHGYDPRTQTRVQFVLMPYLFSPMCGFSALANNIRIKFSTININVKEGVGSTSPFGSGTQPDLYDTGRINTNVFDESKTGGPMGCKILVEPAYSGNAGSPSGSVFPNGELVVAGTSAPVTNGTSAWVSGSGTMTISGTVTVMIQAPAVSGQTANNDSPATIQQLTFVWPQTVVPIPALALNSGSTGATYGLFTNTTGTSTESSNAGTAASVTGTNGKSSSGRISGWGNYETKLLAGSGPGSGYDGDVIRSVPLGGNNLQGDLRIVAATGTVPSGWYAPLKTAITSGTSGPSTYYDSTKPRSYGFWEYGALFNGTPWRNSMTGWLFENKSNHAHTTYQGDANNPTYDSPDSSSFHPYVPEGVSGVYNFNANEGDWDNASGVQIDGAYCNKPDEGTVRHYQQANNYVGSSVAPYIGHPYVMEDSGVGLPTLFSPNRQVSSPVMFGSLPTGVMAQHPWQTLLFRPAKSYFPGGANHPGAAVGANGGLSPGTGVIPYPPYSTPPDHLLLDLFWMPVVDPYPISEPFATAGKVNMNYQIAPFTYITRKTALRAVMQSVKITALNPTEMDNSQGANGGSNSAMLSACYKEGGSFGNSNNGTHANAGVAGTWPIGVGISVRRNIDLDSTLKQMDVLRFQLNKPFISASEICDIPLIPGDQSTVGLSVPYNIGARIKSAAPGGYDAILSDFWYGDPGNTNNSTSSPPRFGHRLTGDNSLERPYSMIYPRLTTKSNTYTVHVRVQTLKKAPTTPANVFKNGQDQVIGEFRGSFVIERYLDPATAGFYLSGTIPAAVNTPGAQLGPYKFRVISSKQFGQ